jgi:ribosome-interacting GTPase 1
VPISAHHKWNYDALLEKLWEYLMLVIHMYYNIFKPNSKYVAKIDFFRDC